MAADKAEQAENLSIMQTTYQSSPKCRDARCNGKGGEDDPNASTQGSIASLLLQGVSHAILHTIQMSIPLSTSLLLWASFQQTLLFAKEVLRCSTGFRPRWLQISALIDMRRNRGWYGVRLRHLVNVEGSEHIKLQL